MPTPTTTTSVAAPAPEPASPALQTFTFPDGHISFSYPAGWSVRTQQGPHLDELYRVASVESVEAVVADASGAEVARVMNGMYGDGAASPVRRTVLDHGPVLGITNTAGEPAEFGFALDEIVGVDSYYFMDVRLAHEFLPTQEDSGTNQVSLPNGEMAAYVVFDFDKQPVFATPDVARIWMATEQYSQLKALLASVKYT
ncbi:MAG: hypothetical protein JWO29_1417 [Arthrobacter sp.]|nr:hypothetical protein [Arthrobacter sp.]